MSCSARPFNGSTQRCVNGSQYLQDVPGRGAPGHIVIVTIGETPMLP